MSILEEDVQRVRDSTDIVAIISERLQLKRVGTRWVGLCPFHSEKSPSFSVNATEGLYHCFGCKASGDAITFVRETEHVDFVGAIEFLANKAGIQLRYSEAGESESRKRHKSLLALMERSVDWYAERLMSAPDAGAARRYLRERGFDREMVERYRLGWAPDSWDALVQSLRVSRDDAEAVGLGFVNKANRLQDFFRGRVLFPIFDDQGRAVAFGGRKLPGADGPKYQNSRENELYHKSSTLYGLHWAKTDIVQAGEVLVCEGYTDVIGFHRAGVHRAVATCGTALTEQHLKVLQRFTSRIVLAYDADQAGQSAAERVYAWERSLGLEVRVVSLPAGEDPDSLSQRDPEALRQAVANSRPFLAFRVDRALAEVDLSSPETRLRSALQPLQLLAEHPDPSVRSAFLVDIATRVRVDEDLLAGTLEDIIRNPKPTDRSAGPNGGGGPSTGAVGTGDDPFWSSLSASPPAGRGDQPRRGRASSGPRQTKPLPVEVAALALVAEDPSQLGHFDPVLFRHPDSHAIYLGLCGGSSVTELAEWLSPSARDLLSETLAGAYLPGDALGAAREAARPSALQLRHELILLVASSELQRLTRAAIPADELGRYAEMTSRAANLVQELRTAVSEGAAEPAREAGDALLDWLVEQSENR